MKHSVVEGKDKGVIVFIHGNSSSSEVFNEVVKSDIITQTKITVDLPGHGLRLMDDAKDEDFSVTANKINLIAFLNQIDDDILLVGNSLGGHLAIEISNNIEKLKGLIILGTPPLKKPINFEEAFLPVPALQTFFTENPSVLEIVEAANVAVFSKEHAQIIISDFKQANPKVRLAVAIDAAENNFTDEYEIFTCLNVPRFIIAGSHDPSVNPEYLKQVNEACKGACELIDFEDCGHYPSLEKPVEFSETIKRIASEVFYV
jgi:pimeloyl-ACP methyl ester carboxylesterase